LYVPPPTPEDQLELMKYYGKKYSLPLEKIEDLCSRIIQYNSRSMFIHPFDATNFQPTSHLNFTPNHNPNKSNDESKKVYSGADIENLCREESMNMVRELVSLTTIAKNQ
jgi:SpoVK/Ycf46/Vps4 family AAA+-type ATPase